MRPKRCMVCRQLLPTVKTLRSHYNAAHSKMQLVRALIKNTIYENNVRRKNRNRFENVRPHYLKTEILYLEDGFQNCDDADAPPLPPKIEIKSETDESKSDVKPVLEEMKRRKENLLKLRNFRFNRRNKRNNSLSLNEQTGLFYVCRCSEDAKANVVVDCFRKNDLQNLISDTDSCSDTVYMPMLDSRCYCDVCGNGYMSKSKLIEHFEVHNRNCRICKKRFSTNFSYKQHMKRHLLKVFVCHLCGAEFGLKSMLMDHLDAHIEDDVFENVFSLEEDYKVGYFG